MARLAVEFPKPEMMGVTSACLPLGLELVMGNFHVVSHLSILEKVVEKVVVVGTQLQGALEQADIHLFNLFGWGSSWY